MFLYKGFDKMQWTSVVVFFETSAVVPTKIEFF